MPEDTGTIAVTPEISQQSSDLAIIVGSLRVTTPAERAYAADLIELTIRPAIKKFKSHFEENLSAWKSGYEKAKAQQAEYVDPLVQFEKDIKAKNKLYDDMQLQIAQEQQRQIQAAALAEQEEIREQSILTRAAELKSEGRDLEAREVASQLSDDAPVSAPIALPAATYRASSGKGVLIKWEYEILDPSKINRAFLIPDLGAIKRLVEKHGEKAIEMIGAGSIRAFQSTSARYSNMK